MMKHISEYLGSVEDYSYSATLKNLGWTDLGKQKLESMLSFTKDHFRLNIFTSTGTVVVQDTNKRYDSGIILKEMTPSKLKRELEVAKFNDK